MGDLPAAISGDAGQTTFSCRSTNIAYIRRARQPEAGAGLSMVLQEMLRHTDFLTMGAFTTGASTMDITPTASVLNSTGEVFKLYGEHFGAGTIPLAVEGNSPQPEPAMLWASPIPKCSPAARPGRSISSPGLSPDGRTRAHRNGQCDFGAQRVAIN